MVRFEFIGDEAGRHTIDDFTLIKTGDTWRLPTLSYVGTPVDTS